MEPTIWVYGLLAAVIVLQLVLSYLYVARTREPEPASTPDIETEIEHDRSFDADAETITCPDCGTQNNSTYQFCRNCVEELPSRPMQEHANDGLRSRGIL